MSPLDGRTYRHSAPSAFDLLRRDIERDGPPIRGEVAQLDERNSSDAEAQIGPDFEPPVAKQPQNKAFKKSPRMGGYDVTGL